MSRLGDQLAYGDVGVKPTADPEKAIDNLCCVLLGRQVERASLSSVRKGLGVLGLNV